MRVGIMGAMIEEVASIQVAMSNTESKELGGRTYISGLFQGVDTVLVFSHWGKVAASSTATTLLNEYQVDMIVFTGVAGAVSPDLSIGDVVVGNEFFEHDMDASPLFEKGQIPHPTNPRRSFKVQEELTRSAESAVSNFFSGRFRQTL